MELQEFSKKLTPLAQLDLPYRLMGGVGGARAAVLIAWASDSIGQASVLLTRRTDTVDHHKGQIAFPGGMIEPGESPLQAAIREAHEEVGIEPSQVTPFGVLPDFNTSTGFIVTPILATLASPIAALQLRANPHEIDSIFWASLPHLQSPGVYRLEPFERGAVRVMTDVFQVGEHRIWGVTGGILKNVLDRLDALK